jgi:hypothetical protein
LRRHQEIPSATELLFSHGVPVYENVVIRQPPLQCFEGSKGSGILRMPVGTCKLCLTKNVELQDSHLLPKAGFRRLREPGSAPVVIKNVMMKKDEQVHDYLFCAACEDRFNRNGEAWVLRNSYCIGNRFLLNDALSAAPVEYQDEQSTIYTATGLPSVDISKLVYFAASVFWRASVHEWRAGKDLLKVVRLGQRFDEEFRTYLLGGPFPNKATLHLFVIKTRGIWNSFSYPHGGRDAGYSFVTFPYFGLVFTLWLGNLVPSSIRTTAFFPCPKNLILKTDVVDGSLIDGVLTRMRDSRRIGSMKKSQS